MGCNNVPPSDPTKECVIFFSCTLQISRCVKRKQNQLITLRQSLIPDLGNLMKTVDDIDQ